MSESTSPAIKTPWGWRFAQRVLRFLLRLLVRLDVQGLENMPDRGPAIITPNHVA
ncbi:MAG TPA: 1-acyl-sn-glycerol-3-phosphate acyltransferase, partial [Anaerolineae bacterium]|nr:1-acyl-sn-glycerol-3-phosphate acyltransferase [Anaerolineae bacterium]